jgi:MFS family permease
MQILSLSLSAQGVYTVRDRVNAVTRVMGRRDLAVLAVGRAVSTAGDLAALIALLLRLRPEGSGWVAALLAAQLIPVVLLAPVAGLVVDRFENRRVLVIALTGQAVAAVPLALVSSPAATVGLFAGLYAFSVFVGPATSALVPAITGEHDSARGYSRLATGSSLGAVLGPAAGGLITGTLGVTTAVLLDAASFAVLAVAAALVRARRRPSSAAERRPGWRGMGGGFEVVWHSPVLRVALAATAIAIACAVVDNVAAPFRFINQLGASSTQYGLYLTIWAAGALIGVQILPRLPQHSTQAALAMGNLLIGVGTAGIGLAPNVPLAFSASALGGIGNGLGNVAQSALVARHSPSEYRGRTFAASMAIIQTAIGVGTAAGAPLVTFLGANGAMILGGCLATSAAAGALVIAITRRTAGPAPTEDAKASTEASS